MEVALVLPISGAPFNILSDQLSVVSLVSHTEASNPLVGQIDFLVTSIHIAAARGGVGLSKHTHTTTTSTPPPFSLADY